MGKHEKNTNVSEAHQQTPGERRGFFEKYGAFLIMAGLIAYVIVLAIGTFAEIFKIQSILDWWIWSPPGKK
jgi:hypothetical protein